VGIASASEQLWTSAPRRELREEQDLGAIAVETIVMASPVE